MITYWEQFYSNFEISSGYQCIIVQWKFDLWTTGFRGVEVIASEHLFEIASSNNTGSIFFRSYKHACNLVSSKNSPNFLWFESSLSWGIEPLIIQKHGLEIKMTLKINQFWNFSEKKAIYKCLKATICKIFEYSFQSSLPFFWQFITYYDILITISDFSSITKFH